MLKNVHDSCASVQRRETSARKISFFMSLWFFLSLPVFQFSFFISPSAQLSSASEFIFACQNLHSACEMKNEASCLRKVIQQRVATENKLLINCSLIHQLARDPLSSLRWTKKCLSLTWWAATLRIEFISIFNLSSKCTALVIPEATNSLSDWRTSQKNIKLCCLDSNDKTTDITLQRRSWKDVADQTRSQNESLKTIKKTSIYGRKLNGQKIFRTFFSAVENWKARRHCSHCQKRFLVFLFQRNYFCGWEGRQKKPQTFLLCCGFQGVMRKDEGKKVSNSEI